MKISRDGVPLVAEALRDVLKNYDEGELVGVSCLVQGLDQIFARVVLEHDGAVEVVLLAADYRERKIESGDLVEFDDLMSCARVVRTLPCAKSDRDAYRAASEEIRDSVDSHRGMGMAWVCTRLGCRTPCWRPPSLPRPGCAPTPLPSRPLLPLPRGRHDSDPAPRHLHHRLVNGAELAQAARLLTQRYTITHDRAITDVTALIDHLRIAGLLTP